LVERCDQIGQEARELPDQIVAAQERWRPAIRDRFGSAHEAQLDFGDPGRNVDSRLLLHRERLQLDRAKRAADQDVGSDAGAHRELGGSTP
jgi:hypothetical protein